MHLFVPDPQKFTNVELNGGEISELVCINGRVMAQNLKSAAACEQVSFFTDEDGWPPWMTSPADDPFDARAAAIPAPLTPSYPVMEFPQFVSKQSENSMRWRNFSHFWGLRKPPKLVAKTSVPEAIVSTVVESNETPFRLEDPTHTSSPGRTPPVSGADQNLRHHRPEKTRLPASETRTRKERQGEDADYLNEEGEAEGSEATKRFHRLCKRSRSAEVHNLAERKRRDRIKEKMKELQQLIPCSNNVDKASLLDDAIQYIKSLQLQLQMMSMVCGMVPMMHSGMQPCMPLCGMAMGMGMNQSIPPYPPTVPSLSRPCPASATHIGPMCQILHPFQLQQVSVSDTSIIQAGNQTGRPPVLSIPTADAHQQPCSGINTTTALATAGNGTRAS